MFFYHLMYMHNVFITFLAACSARLRKHCRLCRSSSTSKKLLNIKDFLKDCWFL